jgi:two-component system cell cycle sensor histidine kinase PleC
MAHRADSRVSARTFAVTGLASSIAGPGYIRLLSAEPWIRRIVPALIVLFILVVGAAGILQALGNREKVLTDARQDLVLITAAISHQIETALQARRDQDPAAGSGPARGGMIQSLISQLAPVQARIDGRRLYIVDRDGTVVAAEPLAPSVIGRPADGVFDIAILEPAPGAPRRPGPIFRDMTARDGTRLLAVASDVPALSGRVLLVQPETAALDVWESDTMLAITLFATTASVLLILGFAFHWQSTRAREADLIYAEVSTRFDTALLRGRCGLWDWDVARGTIYWSDSMHDLLGRVATGRLMSFADVNALMHPDDPGLFRIAVEVAEGQTATIDHEFRMRHADGHYVWLRARAELVQQAGHPGPHLIGIAVDVTEQKQLADARSVADRQLGDAIESTSEAFVLWDAEDRLVAWNSKFASIYGMPAALLARGAPGARIADVIATRVVRTRTQYDGPSAAGAQSFECELDDGRWLNVNERRTRDGGRVAVATDISALKTNEAELLENERRIWAMVQDLRTSQQTLEFQAQQLAELAEKYNDEKLRAEDASRAKSDFIARMSHDLRTPLNAIIGFAQIMNAGTFGPLGTDKYREYCDDIQKSGEALLEIVNDILQMSSIESGRLKLDPQVVAPGDLIEETIRAVRGEADRKLITIDTQIDPAVVLNADPRAMRQILHNLMSNAVKFTPDGGRIVARVRGHQHHARVVICDSGIGIPRDAIRRLCQPFEQAEGTFARRHGGSGLGLAIARSLTEMQGGAMRIRSAIGMGTTVVVQLPQAEPDITTGHGMTRH